MLDCLKQIAILLFLESLKSCWTVKTKVNPLKSLMAFGCGGFWDHSRQAYKFDNAETANHFLFIVSPYFD